MKVKQVIIRNVITGMQEEYEDMYIWKYKKWGMTYVAISEESKGEPTIGRFNPIFTAIRIKY